MRIEEIRTLAGPNVWTHKPVLVMMLDLEELTERESREFAGFNERLIEALPGVREHHCGLGRRGGFVERLHGGTYFGHIVEHVALEMSEAAGIPVNFGKARYAGRPGLYNVIVEYRSKQGMRHLLLAAVGLVEAFVRGEPFALEEQIEEARRIVRHTEPGLRLRSILKAAAARNIPQIFLDQNLVQLGWGRHRRLIRTAVPDTNTRDVDLVVEETGLPAEENESGADIVSALFPDDYDGRIPVISITGTNGRTTVTRMIAHTLAEAGLCTGVTTTGGAWAGGELIAVGDTSGHSPVRGVLAERMVEVAVFEAARGSLVRWGLGYDWSDISVLTDIKPDQLGRDGIESVEDLIHIKSLVAERVREGGTLILNADDEHLSRLHEAPRVREPQRRIVFFSTKKGNQLVRAHIQSGGAAYLLRDGLIVEAAEGSERGVVHAADVTVTEGGTAEFQIANVLAAVAASRAYGLGLGQCVSAMKSFRDESSGA